MTKFDPGNGFNSFYKLNLEDAPFNLRPPLLAIGRDGVPMTHGLQMRVMGLWRLPLW